MYFLWAARLRTSGRGAETIDQLTREAQALINTYLEGAGIFAWRENDAGTGYESIVVPTASQVTDLDDVLYRIASEINALKLPNGAAPEPVRPTVRAVDLDQLADDQPSDQSP